MDAQLAHTTQEDGSQRAARARYYSDAVWRDYKSEVHDMYLRPSKPCTLDEMRSHFRNKYGFCPSKKQWKERLHKWHIQRNLDLRTAAIILCLFREANSQGLHRRVTYNKREKTAKDIANYIAKSSKISSEEQLLTHLPHRAGWPRSVEWEDGSASNTGATLTVPEPGTSAVSDGHFTHQPPASTTAGISEIPSDQGLYQGPSFLTTDFDLAQQRFNALEAAGDTFDWPFFNPLSQLGYAMPQQDWNLQQRQQRQFQQQWDNQEIQVHASTQQQWHQYSTPQPHAPTVMNGNPLHVPTPQVYHPQQRSMAPVLWNTPAPRAHDASQDSLRLAMLNAAASATPIALADAEGSNTTPEQQLDKHVRYLMGNIEDLDPKPSDRFMYHCLEATLYAAYDAAEKRDEAISKAGNNFREVLTTLEGFSSTLPLLNKLSFMAEAYGHRALKQRILQSLRPILQRDIRGLSQRDLLLVVLDMLLETAEPANSGTVPNQSRADWIYNSAVTLTTNGNTSKFAIAARYNQAWVLLENERYQDALDILLRESSLCESIFGTDDVQTICWLATLARAHLKSGEALRALSLMRESVLIRAERAFDRNHPFYWEINYRIGLFLCGLAKHNTIPDSTEDFWREGEEHLTDTLLWRAENLGLDNSQTLKALQWLNCYLGKQGKLQNAEDLVRSYRAEASDD